MRELDIPALNENLPEVLKFVKDNLDEIGCTGKEAYEIEVAVEEIFTNIAGYAYDPDIGAAVVRVELIDEPLTVSIDFVDQGTPYDPLAKPDPNVKLSLKDRARGGLGIFMTKKFMDSVQYEYKTGRNILTLRKKILRQPEVDLAKAVVIFFLATIHVFVECSTDTQLWTGLPYFFDSILGGPWAAPMFLFSMGIGLAFTSKNKPEDLIRRGLHIGVLGLLLNVTRFLIPSVVGYLITGDKAFYIEPLPYRFFGNDLLQFASLAMLLMGALRYLKLKPWHVFIVGLGMSVASNFLNNIWFGSMPLNVILGHFIGIDDGTEKVMSDFPLMFWFVLYSSGLVFGEYLKKMKDKAKFYKIVSAPCLIISTVVYVIEYKKGFGMMGGPGANVFYHLTTPEVFLCIATMFGMLGVYYLITRHLPQKALDIIERVSRNITIVYIIQWTLVWWVADVFIYIIRGSKYLPAGVSLVIGLVLSVLTMFLAEYWQTIKARRAAKRTAIK